MCELDYYWILICSKSLQCVTLHWVRHGRSHIFRGLFTQLFTGSSALYASNKERDADTPAVCCNMPLWLYAHHVYIECICYGRELINYNSSNIFFHFTLFQFITVSWTDPVVSISTTGRGSIKTQQTRVSFHSRTCNIIQMWG